MIPPIVKERWPRDNTQWIQVRFHYVILMNTFNIILVVRWTNNLHVLAWHWQGKVRNVKVKIDGLLFYGFAVGRMDDFCEKHEFLIKKWKRYIVLYESWAWREYLKSPLLTVGMIQKKEECNPERIKNMGEEKIHGTHIKSE